VGGNNNIYFAGKLVMSRGVIVATDRLGTVRANGNGEQFAYYPYGEERTSTADGREKFGTYVRDSPTQDYADQRYYGVGTGRFNVPDSLGLSGAISGIPGSFNRYSYVKGDPINSLDPSGMVSCSLDGISVSCDIVLPECGFGAGERFIQVGGPEGACQQGGPGEEGLGSYQPDIECNATLDSRPLDIKGLKQLGLTHAYWELQIMVDGQIITDVVVSAGPTPDTKKRPIDPKTGKRFTALDVWVHDPQAAGPDKPQNATWGWSTDWSKDNCAGVAAMLGYARNWETNYNDSPTGVHYGGITGPNSNSFAAYLGKFGGFSPPKPPGAWGWGYWL
jgi:RHS repeat-associated protein